MISGASVRNFGLALMSGIGAVIVTILLFLLVPIVVALPLVIVVMFAATLIIWRKSIVGVVGRICGLLVWLAKGSPLVRLVTAPQAILTSIVGIVLRSFTSGVLFVAVHLIVPTCLAGMVILIVPSVGVVQMCGKLNLGAVMLVSLIVSARSDVTGSS